MLNTFKSILKCFVFLAVYIAWLEGLMRKSRNARDFCVSDSSSREFYKPELDPVYCIRCMMVCKIGFTNWNAKIALLRASMVVTYNIKLFQTGADRHNGILMSLLLLVAGTTRETINILTIVVIHYFSKWASFWSIWPELESLFNKVAGL